MIEHRFGSYGERVKALRDAIEAARQARGWSHLEFSQEAGINRATIRRILKPDGDITPRDNTLERLEKFVTSIQRNRGFDSADLYRAIAEGMNASLTNQEFIKLYTGEYRMVRAHVPTQLALVSTLHIHGDPDNMVIRYNHQHVVSDALSLFDDEEEANNPQVATGTPLSKRKPKIKKNWRAPTTQPNVLSYNGFVFNSERRAFLLATSPITGHIKEIVLSMPAAAPLAQASIRGLVLTVSADERDPFAARIMVVKWPPPNLNDVQAARWEPGLKQWEAMPAALQREFRKDNNYGLLRLHA